MSKQKLLWSGDELKRQGQDKAIEAVPDYRKQFLDWIRNQPSGTLHTFEDITNSIGLPRGDQVGSNRNNAVGALMSSCAKMGLQHKISRVKAKRPNQHGTEIGLWQRSSKHLA